jgi:SAM-dependent methyltransferase
VGLPFKSGQLDWIMMRNVYSLINPQQIGQTFEECARVLKRGGLLLINEFYNPHHAGSRAALLKIFSDMEIGAGTAGHPDGPIFKARLKIIEEAAGDRIKAETARKLALETAYKSAATIRKSVAAAAARKKTDKSTFDARDVRRSPVWPDTGIPIAGACDPFEIRTELKRAGFTCRFRKQYLDSEIEEKELKSYYAASQGVYLTAVKSK